jgi:hypothetical protein
MADQDACSKCKQIHNPKKCVGHSLSRGGAQCGKYPQHGQRVCEFHGGAAPQNRAKARERLAERDMRKALGKLNIVPVDNPILELSRLAGEVKAWKELCAAHVAELQTMRYSTDGGEAIRGEIQLFERAMDRCLMVLGTIAKLNIDERLVRINEKQVSEFVAALRLSMARQNLAADTQRAVMVGVAEALRPSMN